MQRVFGLPAGGFAAVLTVVLALSAAAIAVLALRRRVFFRIGVRNIPRRPARTSLIIVGLMLGTAIISSALLTGDTMARAVRGSVLTALGHTDQMVVAGARAPAIEGLETMRTAQPYFEVAPVLAAVDGAAGDLPVDGTLAAIVEPLAARHPATERSEPRLTLFAPDAEGVEPFELDEIATLEDGQVLLDPRAASNLDASVGDEIELLIGERNEAVTVGGIDRWRGVGTDGAAVLMPLEAAQRLLDRPGEANHVLVSNEGGPVAGADHTATVLEPLRAAVAPLGLTVEPVKEDGLAQADTAGDAFVQMFTTFGSFSIAAGILLIFLIFVMLASERRAEMGMARAVGTQRRHLVQSFLFEGAVYDVIAAAVGVALGIAVSFVMVEIVGSVFTTETTELNYSLSTRSLLIGYALGALLTLGVVTVSAWRVSRLNIVSAIRDLDEPPRGGRTRSAVVALAVLVPVGLALAVSGATGQVFVTWMLGVSLLLFAIAPAVQLMGGSRRAGYTAAGALIVGLWLLPLGFFDRLFGEMTADFSIWVVGGLLLVVAATWVITFNADLLLRGLAWATSPVASLRPIVRMAVAYPLASRFRTGVTMAMFMLVVFTLVTGTVIPTAFTRALDDVDTFGGGFDARVSLAPTAAVADLRDELPGELSRQIETVGAQSFVPALAHQDGTPGEPAIYPVRGLDDDYLAATTYELVATARGYESSEAVWDAMRADPTLAVVDAFVAPRRQNWAFALLPEFQLSGFYVDDGPFTPVPVTVTDPLTGESATVTVVGVLSDTAPWAMAGISVAQDGMGIFGDRALPTIHHLGVAPGQDAEAVAAAVETSLLASGAEADTYASLLADLVADNLLFLRLVQGFMALGLVVGVAALGVVMARAVVERRQQLGMLRAIGFQPAMIRRTVLAESSIMAGLPIVVGALLGLALSYNVIADSRTQPGWANLSFSVPWVNLLVVFAAVFLAAQLTTYLPARRASRVYPAEALRYQ